MKLGEIRIKTIEKNITMTKLAEEIGIDRRTMYDKIKKGEEKTIEKIKNYFAK